MPRGDGTGPAGFGQMTGRAAGYCAGFPVSGYMNPQSGFRGAEFGRGRGWGRGLGRGQGKARMYGAPGGLGWVQSWHPRWAATPCYPGVGYPHPAFQGVPPYGSSYAGYGPKYGAEAMTEQELSYLKEEAAFLKEELEAVQGRLEELGKQETDDTGKDK